MTESDGTTSRRGRPPKLVLRRLLLTPEVIRIAEGCARLLGMDFHQFTEAAIRSFAAANIEQKFSKQA